MLLYLIQGRNYDITVSKISIQLPKLLAFNILFKHVRLKIEVNVSMNGHKFTYFTAFKK